MKTSRTYFVFSLFFSLFLIVTSCKKDDAPIVDIPDPQVVLPPDYVVLKSLYDANSNNSIDWDFDDTTMKTWSGVTLAGERVTQLDISGKSLSTLTDKIGELTELTSFKADDNTIYRKKLANWSISPNCTCKETS